MGENHKTGFCSPYSQTFHSTFQCFEFFHHQLELSGYRRKRVRTSGTSRKTHRPQVFFPGRCDGFIKGSSIWTLEWRRTRARAAEFCAASIQMHTSLRCDCVCFCMFLYVLWTWSWHPGKTIMSGRGFT